MSATEIAACVVLRVAMSNIFDATVYYESLEDYPDECDEYLVTLNRGMSTASGLLGDRRLQLQDVLAVATREQVYRLQAAGRSSGYYCAEDDDIPGTIFMHEYLGQVIEFMTG